jgi:chromosome segregation ATPase
MHQTEKRGLESSAQVLNDKAKLLEEQLRQAHAQLTRYETEIGEQLLATEKIVETIVGEKEQREFELQRQILELKGDLGRKDEETTRLRKNYEALRLEFRTLKEENTSILEENKRLRGCKGGELSFLHEVGSPKAEHPRSQSWNNNEPGEEYNHHLLKSIQKLAASKASNRSSHKAFRALRQPEAELVLKASTAGEDTLGEIFS